MYKMSLISEEVSGIDLLNNEYILPHIQFSKQRSTIITWADKERQQDLAVSFQNVEGAKQVWDKIKQICQMLGIDIDQHSQQSHNQQDEDYPITLDTIQRIADDLKIPSQLDNSSRTGFVEQFLDNDCANLMKLGELFELVEKKA